MLDVSLRHPNRSGEKAFVDCRDRSLPDWTSSHVRILEAFQGVPELLVPDNEKSGVKAASHYEPDVNPSDHDLVTHYGTTVLPTRPYAPRDQAKAKVEGSRQIFVLEMRDVDELAFEDRLMLLLEREKTSCALSSSQASLPVQVCGTEWSLPPQKETLQIDPGSDLITWTRATRARKNGPRIQWGARLFLPRRRSGLHGEAG